MADLVPVDKGGLTAIISQGLPSLQVQPFAQEIYLTHFDVAGLMYVANVEDILDVLEVGQRLVLCREPKNKYDEYAILVQDEKRQKIGYMPRRMNHIPARLMDAGKLLIAKVISVRNTDGFYRVSIGIYLVDY